MELNDTYKYLEDFGFDIAKLKTTVESKMQSSEQYVQAVQYLPFDETDMRFEFNFLRHNIDGDFYLESIKSVYTPLLDIPSLQVGSVDTETLDRRMWNMDWTRYFNARGSMSDGELAEIAPILADLQILSESKDEYYVADDLKIKHWPESMLMPHLLELKGRHQRIELFNPGEDELWSPALAYYRLTGQQEDLLNKMVFLRIPQLGYADLTEEILTMLMEKQEAFDFHHSYFDGEAFVKLKIPIRSIDSSFHIDEFHASVKQLPEIEYGIFNGINSFLLYAKMNHTDWEAGEEWFLRETNSFKPPVDEIMEMLDKITLDETGSKIASNLKLRFWADNDFFEIYTDKKDRDFLDYLPTVEDKFPVELNVERGVNLLKGNAVYLDTEMFAGREVTGWLVMNRTGLTETGNHPIEALEDFTEEQLIAQMDMLPISNYWYYSVRDRLLSGYIVNVALKDGMEIFLKADPVNSTLRIYDEYKQEIPFNFNLDVNWRPFVQQQENTLKIAPETPKESQQPPTVKPKKPAKKFGRGI